MSAVDPGLTDTVQRVEASLGCAEAENVQDGSLYCRKHKLVLVTPQQVCPEALAVARAAREDVLALTQQARADAWDEGWAKCSDWWHANAVGESHTVDPTNPYRAADAPPSRDALVPTATEAAELRAMKTLWGQSRGI